MAILLYGEAVMTDYNQRKEHFRDAMADILKRKVEFPRGTLVTVADAKLTNDLQFANTVLSVLPTTAKKEVLEALNEFRNDIKKEMALKLGMRRIPKLHWSFDDKLDYVDEMDTYINKLKTEGEL